MFRTRWFIGHYCSERKGRGYRCRWPSVPFSLYFISILWLHSKYNRKGDGLFRFQTITEVLTTLLLTLFSTFSIRPSILFLFSYSCNAFPHFFFYFYYTTLHSLTSSLPGRSRLPPFRCENRIKIQKFIFV